MKIVSFVLATGLALAGTMAHADPSALVSLATARQGSLAPRVAAYGTVAADTSHVATIAAPRDSIVVHVAVRPGQAITPADTIVAIATAPAATTQYRQAASTLAFAQKDLAHTRELFAERLATRSQLAAAEKALSDAEAQMAEQTRIGADQPTQSLHSPTAGVVASLSAQSGDRIQQGAAIATIATRNGLVLNVGLEPEDAPRLTVGGTVTLRSPQNAQTSFAGRVVSIGAMIDPQSRLINAVVAVPQADARTLILGTVLRAELALAPSAGIVVPKDAVMTDGEGNYVFVVAKGAAHRRNVSLAFMSGGDALITSGLSANEQVVVTGNAGLEDNTAVRTR